MFILGDETYDRGKLPWVTFTLMGVCFLVFCAQCRFGDKMTNGWGLVPKEIVEFRDITTKQPVKVPGHDFFVDEDGEVQVHGNDRVLYVHHYPGPVPIVLTLFTYMFLHGGFFHLVFNLWFLFIFGRNVECSLDHGKFLAFYVFCGVMAGLAQVGADYNSVIPIVGASGAIAGVMGAYLAIFPWNNIKILFGGIGLFFGIVEVPAFLVIGFWFMGEYLMGTMTHDAIGGTAYWCHIGGFITGFATVKALLLYVKYQLSQLEAEREAERVAHALETGEDPAALHPVDALPAPDVPTAAQVENMLDPVEAFKKARNGVFRDCPENNPFDRPADRPLIAELVEDEPKPKEQGIVAKLPKPKPGRLPVPVEKRAQTVEPI